MAINPVQAHSISCLSCRDYFQLPARQRKVADLFYNYFSLYAQQKQYKDSRKMPIPLAEKWQETQIAIKDVILSDADRKKCLDIARCALLSERPIPLAKF